MSSHIFLAGASRGVGREIALQLLKDGHQVTALLRTDETQAELEALGITTVLGNALDAEAVQQAVANAGAIDAVFSTLGGPQSGDRSDYVGNRNLIDAAVQAGIPRFILISSIGAGDSRGAVSPQVLESLLPALLEKDKAEAHLVNSGLNYTIIRPGGLRSEPATGTAVVSHSNTISGMIHRADVAALACQCLNSPAASKQIFSAVDPNQQFVPVNIEAVAL